MMASELGSGLSENRLLPGAETLAIARGAKDTCAVAEQGVRVKTQSRERWRDAENIRRASPSLRPCVFLQGLVRTKHR